MNHTATQALAVSVIDADDDLHRVPSHGSPLVIDTANCGVSTSPDELGTALVVAAEHLASVKDQLGTDSSAYVILSAHVAELAGRYLAACHEGGVAA